MKLVQVNKREPKSRQAGPRARTGSPMREGRDPASGEKIKIAASRKLTYSPAKAVKELLNG
jgi:nucleoid DNA-binding protein